MTDMEMTFRPSGLDWDTMVSRIVGVPYRTTNQDGLTTSNKNIG